MKIKDFIVKWKKGVSNKTKKKLLFLNGLLLWLSYWSRIQRMIRRTTTKRTHKHFCLFWFCWFGCRVSKLTYTKSLHERTFDNILCILSHRQHFLDEGFLRGNSSILSMKLVQINYKFSLYWEFSVHFEKQFHAVKRFSLTFKLIQFGFNGFPAHF